jgi:NAD(P)-dependent dehydrogenase (short-subunit alcohol dehydrogenase family)
MQFDVSGKVILVAGGTGGLGRFVSLAFLAEGAAVAVSYRNPGEFAALQQSAGSAAASLTGHRVDVTDESAVAEVVAQILAAHNRLDALVNTIGGYAGGIPFWNLDSATLDRMLSLNLRAGYVLAHAALVPMRRQGSGSIVNVNAKAALDHAAGAAAYAASKAASLALFDSLAADLRGSAIRVNSILPSIIDTPANRNAMPSADFAAWPKPDDIARVILFLASDASRVIHGAAIPVYGTA